MAETMPRPKAAGVSITHAPDMHRWIFRGGAAAALECGRLFGVELPQVACRANANDARAALWLGPDEWLLLRAGAEAFDVSALMLGHSLVDISHRQIGLEISGPAAARLLNSFVMLDLDAAAFTTGSCTRTLFGKAEIVLWRKGAETFHVEVWRSFAGYVTGLLREACKDLA